jgi:hypothetical protein
VSRGSKGHRGDGSWWLNGGKHGSAVVAMDRVGKGCSMGRGAPFIAARGGWQMAVRVAVGGGGVVAAAVGTSSARAAPLFGRVAD